MMPKTRYITTIILISAWLLAGCGGDSADDVQRPVEKERQEISIKTNVKKMTEGTTRTGFYTNDNLETFQCYAYKTTDGSTYINTTVSKVSESGPWAFADGSHQWPEESLDFFAYMPTSPSYISDIAFNYSTNSVTFTCAGVTSSASKEFIYATALDQNKTNNAAGVNLGFLHPFARVQFDWADYDHSDITLTSITLNSIAYSGTYNSTNSPHQWTPSSAPEGLYDLVLNNLGSSAQILVIPQSFTCTIQVVATGKKWQDEDVDINLSTNVSINWEPGKSYTYLFTITYTDLKVDVVDKFTEQW